MLVRLINTWVSLNRLHQELEAFIDSYHQRLRLIWSSLLSGPRKSRATNSFCVPMLSNGFGIIPWTVKEIEQFDVSTRKILTVTCNHHPRGAVERLYLHRTLGGIGLINVKNLFYRRLGTIAHHLSNSSDALVKLCYELDCLLPARSTVSAIANSYCATLLITIDFQSCDLISLKSLICKMQLNNLKPSLTAKPPHGRFFSLLDDQLIDRRGSLRWLKHHIHSETESIIFTIQDQVISTRVVRLRLCTSMYHLCYAWCMVNLKRLLYLLSACPKLATSVYLYRHNLIAGALHWHLLKTYVIPCGSKSWFTHAPPTVIETSTVKILWNFSLQST